MAKTQFNFGFSIHDLYHRDGLLRLDEVFLDHLKTTNPDLFDALQTARRQPPKDLMESSLIIDLAPTVEEFIAGLFEITTQVKNHIIDHATLSPIFVCKRLFVQRQALKKYSATDIDTIDGKSLERTLKSHIQDFNDLAFAKAVLQWLKNEPNNKDLLDIAEKYAAWRTHHDPQILFHLPQKTGVQHGVETTYISDKVLTTTKPIHHRDGFKLTDPGASFAKAQDHVSYCLYCHDRGKDSCRTGLPDKKLSGCPLDQKISEMNVLKSGGHSIGALATIIIDNPMLAATGHRICNDCMKSCIFQKQEPVDVPNIETRILKDVLALPYGFEVYSLLTRWNPLNFARPLPKESTGHTIMVAGMGPAGFTLAHHLLNDGHTVIGVDALKIEPIDTTITAIKNSDSLFTPLDERIMAGFGGVAEFGITVRWDKNFLHIIRLLLERRSHFQLQGGVRIGSTITIDQIFNHGIDHLALCLGAGSPKILTIPGIMAKGVRQASDFLMALQLTGAAKDHSLANLQIRAPIVVIGGGLTATDTATEAKAYYSAQVKKFAGRYQKLKSKNNNLEENWTPLDQKIAKEFLHDATKNVSADVTIAYRKSLTKSPAFQTSSWEIESALQEGILFMENADPSHIEVDEDGWASHIVFKDGRKISAKTVLVAAGTLPNTMLSQEDPRLKLTGKFFTPLGDHLIYRHDDGRSVSYLGDLHPDFHGSVVKAMASAKNIYPLITKDLKNRSPQKINPDLSNQLQTTVHKIEKVADDLYEIIFRAPQAALNTKPGHFFRLQRFEKNAKMTPEAVAINAYDVDTSKGLIKTFLQVRGASSKLLTTLTEGEAVTLMGPTGSANHIPTSQHILLLAEGVGHLTLLPLLKSMRDNKNTLTFISCSPHPVENYIRPHVDHYQQTDPASIQLPTTINTLYAAGSALFLNTCQKLMQTNKAALHTEAIIHSPMQCMMKEICAQCLQRHEDPATGATTIVFSCVNQNQSLTTLDTKSLADRLTQNSLQEKLTSAWIETTLKAS